MYTDNMNEITSITFLKISRIIIKDFTDLIGEHPCYSLPYWNICTCISFIGHLTPIRFINFQTTATFFVLPLPQQLLRRTSSRCVGTKSNKTVFNFSIWTSITSLKRISRVPARWLAATTRTSRRPVRCSTYARWGSRTSLWISSSFALTALFLIR